MKLYITPRAKQDIRQQLDFSAARFGPAVAERTFERIFAFFDNVLANYPKTAAFDNDLNLYASWIPRTPFVVFYRLDEAAETLIVVALLHHAQDRSTLEGEE